MRGLAARCRRCCQQQRCAQRWNLRSRRDWHAPDGWLLTIRSGDVRPRLGGRQDIQRNQVTSRSAETGTRLHVRGWQFFARVTLCFFLKVTIQWYSSKEEAIAWLKQHQPCITFVMSRCAAEFLHLFWLVGVWGLGRV
jgi:hypothetical protein